MRVLQLIDHMGSGGAQTIVYDLARLLPNHGIDVEVAHLFAPNVFADRLAELDIVTHDLSTGSSYRPIAALDPRPAARLRRLMRAGSFDAINLHLYIAPIHARLAAPGAFRTTRIVNTVHAHRAELPGYVFASYRLTRSRTDAFVGDFSCSRQELLDAGVSDDAVEYIPFGVDPVDPIDAERQSRARSELGISADTIVLLSVARLHPQRFIDRFIDAMERISASTRNVLLLVAGDGESRESLEDLATARGVDTRVRFLGRRADLDVLFGIADVYLSVSRGGDVGIAALQAMSAGLPCVAWDNAGLERAPHLHSDELPLSTASSIDGFAERVKALVEDKELRSAVGDQSRDIVRSRHSAAAMTAAYADLYRRG